MPSAEFGRPLANTKVITSERLIQDPSARDLSRLSPTVYIVDHPGETTLRILPPEDSASLTRGPNGQELEHIGLFNGEPYPLASFKGFKGVWQKGLKPGPDNKSFTVPPWAVLKTDVVKGTYAGRVPQRVRILEEVDLISSSGTLQIPLFEPNKQVVQGQEE